MQNPGRGIRLRGSARSDTGRVRDNNEDSVHLWSHDSQLILAVVADGMGGAVAGEEASRIAIDTIKHGFLNNKNSPESFRSLRKEDISEQLKSVIREANINIVTEAAENPELKGMGTTVTMAFVRGTHVILGHVGDSRAYLVGGSKGDIKQITSDHSFVQALVAAGHISEDEAEEHPMRNVLYRALGQSRDVEVDVYYQELRAGDRLILCSDGLTLHVRPYEIAQMTLNHEDPEQTSKHLIQLANDRGGRDNVSVIVVQVDETKAARSQEVDSAKDDDIDSDDEEVDFDADTLLLHKNPGFASSESANASQQEPPDASLIKRKTSEFVSISDVTLGEGQDTLRPDQ